MSRTLIIGDVHGCASELAALVEAAKATDVILVGDLFTKGPDPGGVWRLIQEHHMRSVLGNQDERLLKALGRPDGAAARLRHCIEALDAVDPAWRDWLAERPLFLDVADYTVVHAGLHPSGDLAKTTREMALNMRGFPMSESAAPRWHEQYAGARGVVFGHDARGGLVRRERNGASWLIGLDSGCVYGGSLSGFIPEDDRVLQVPAGAVYQAVGGSPTPGGASPAVRRTDPRGRETGS